MITCRIAGDDLCLELTGWHALLACRWSLRVPVAAITSVRPRDAGLRPAWARCPGTCIPGLITAGTYLARGRKEFWFVRRKRPAWVIDVAGQPWTRLVLDVALPDTLRDMKP